MIRPVYDPNQNGQVNKLINPDDLSKIPATHEYGWIYFLWNESRLVYVGQSHKVISRIYQHVSTKKFTHFSIQPCHIAYMDQLEAAYIAIYKPQYNSTSPKIKYKIQDMMQNNFMKDHYPIES